MESRFRIWHKPTKTIQYVARIDFNNCTVDTYGIAEPIYNIPMSDSIIMQTVGLKDKKGIPVYEGSIILHDHSLYFEENHIWQVCWGGVYGWRARKSIHANSGEMYNEPMSRFYEHKIEVIGNIYENPELLKHED